jgi:preprotein translocase subunit SecG
LTPYLNLVQIVISVALMLFVLLQSKGAGFSGTFSNDSSVFRTRRGVEKTLFHFTLGLAAVFVIISIVSVLTAGSVLPTGDIPTIPLE